MTVFSILPRTAHTVTIPDRREQDSLPTGCLPGPQYRGRDSLWLMGMMPVTLGCGIGLVAEAGLELHEVSAVGYKSLGYKPLGV